MSDIDNENFKSSKTYENLQTAFAGESQARVKYQFFASQAKKDGYEQISAIFTETSEEGFHEIAAKFEGVAAIEKQHEERYRKLIKNIDDDVVFKSEKVTVWKCRNCGYTFVGEEAPEVCPVCSHPQAFFEIRAINY